MNQIVAQNALLMKELVIDSFAGGGGASEGIKIALGRDPDIAVNHDWWALCMHRINHPGTRHVLQDVAVLDSVGLCAGQPIGMLWMSPDCTDHSKAKGSAPIRDGVNTRGIGWAIVGWVKGLPMWQRPRVVFLENVEEYEDWGPLLPDGKRDPARKGEIFDQFVAAWKALGYTKIEWRQRRAWRTGAGTIRNRLYMIMRRDGEPIVWPEPTHGNPGNVEDAARIAAGELQTWVSVADGLDFSLPCPSIFDTSQQIREKFGIRAKRPLAPKSMARMAKGLKRHVVDEPRPFMVKVNHVNDDARDRSVSDPLGAMTGKRGDALVTPYITKFRSGSVGHAATGPLHTVTAHRGENGGGGAAPLGLVAPLVAYAQHGGNTRTARAPSQTITASPKDQNQVVTAHILRQFGNSIGSSATAPNGTDTAGGGGKSAVVATYVAQHNDGPRQGIGSRPSSAPLSTVTTTGSQQAFVAATMMTLRGSERRSASAGEPARTISAQGSHHALISLPFMSVYYGTDDAGAPVNQPSRTETAKPRFGLVEALAEVPPFSVKHHDRARQVADFMREHGCWDGGEFVTMEVDGITIVIVDIGMRMLTPRERFNAQGFRRDYIIDHGLDEDGNRVDFTTEQQGYMCGNSVCPTEAAALVAANYRPRDVKAPRCKAPEKMPLFVEAAE